MVRLESERMYFRDHRPEDLGAFCEMESDPHYRWPQKVHPWRELERSFAEAWLPTKPLGLLATVLKSDGCYIGRCGLCPRRDESGGVVEGEAEIAHYLARPYWGQGLATEAGRAFVAYGFGSLGLTRIHAGVNADNLASLRVVGKLGFACVRSGEGGGSRWHDYVLTNPS